MSSAPRTQRTVFLYASAHARQDDVVHGEVHIGRTAERWVKRRSARVRRLSGATTYRAAISRVVSAYLPPPLTVYDLGINKHGLYYSRPCFLRYFCEDASLFESASRHCRCWTRKRGEKFAGDWCVSNRYFDEFKFQHVKRNKILWSQQWIGWSWCSIFADCGSFNFRSV